jgi:hypothetical protein
MLLASSSQGRPREGFSLPQKLMSVDLLARGSSRGTSPCEASGLVRRKVLMRELLLVIVDGPLLAPMSGGPWYFKTTPTI